MAEIRKGQKRHTPLHPGPSVCIAVHAEGDCCEGGYILKAYRTLASDTFFQAYLVDGLARWNEDWSLAAAGREQPYSCSGLQRYAANQLAQEVLGRTLVDYTGSPKYTGVEYLYEQTGNTLENHLST